MLYKILLDDNSFIIADDNYVLTLFKKTKKKKLSVKDYLINNKFWEYYLVDLINNKKIIRHFTIEPLNDATEQSLGIKIGSRIKYASDIKENDLVVGVDGKPRRVNNLHTGEDDMYNIEVNGQSYIVNGGHILSLVDKDTGEHLDIQLNVYLHMDDEFKSHYLMEIKEDD